MVRQGDRVVVIAYADASTVTMFGHGTFEGYGVPDQLAAGAFAREARLQQLSVPVLKLNTGELVYGSECYWMEEHKFAAFKGKRTVETITLAEYRGTDGGETLSRMKFLFAPSVKCRLSNNSKISTSLVLWLNSLSKTLQGNLSTNPQMPTVSFISYCTL